MADEGHARGPGGGESEHDEEGRGDRDGDAEAGDALNEAGEAPSDEEGLREPVVGEPGHGASDGVDALQLVDEVEHVDGRPDDGKDEDGEAEALGAGDGDVVLRGAEDEQGEGEREEPRGGAGAGSAPLELRGDDGHDEEDYGRGGQQPVGEGEVGACHKRRRGASGPQHSPPEGGRQRGRTRSVHVCGGGGGAATMPLHL